MNFGQVGVAFQHFRGRAEIGPLRLAADPLSAFPGEAGTPDTDAVATPCHSRAPGKYSARFLEGRLRDFLALETRIEFVGIGAADEVGLEA
jgi:hypothetical protein